MYSTYLAANTFSGVYKIDPIDYPELELMNARDFMESLSTLSDSEQIFTAFDSIDDDLYHQIDNEYGIR